MIEFAPTLALGALVFAFTNWVRYIRAHNFNGVLTQFLVWLSGVAAVMLTAQSDWADGIHVGGLTLGSTNAWSQVLVGITIASQPTVVNEALKAIDRFQTAAKPDLLPDSKGEGVVVEQPAVVVPQPPQG